MTIREFRDTIDIEKTIRMLRGYLKINHGRDGVDTKPLSTGYGAKEARNGD
jgi:hypothetical protein